MAAVVRRDDTLFCGRLALEDLATRYGTPLYIYDAEVLEYRYRRFESAFEGLDLLVAYSVKANGNLTLLNRLAALGSGADIVSGGELHRALTAGVPAERIVAAGAGKGRKELAAALDAGIYGFNVESEGELHLLDRVATERQRRAPVALRVNLDIVSPTPHEYTRTGHAATKFGIPKGELLDLYEWAASRPWLAVRGIATHIGSQIVQTEPYERAIREVVGVVRALAELGIDLEYVDLGGGFGVTYEDESEIDLARLAEAVASTLAGTGLRLVLEPGRFVVGEAGSLLTRVLDVKRSGEKTFVVTDGGMTELLRPSHYGGYHRIEPVRTRPGAPTVTADVVGPVCESASLIRERETLADLIRGEPIP